MNNLININKQTTPNTPKLKNTDEVSFISLDRKETPSEVIVKSIPTIHPHKMYNAINSSEYGFTKSKDNILNKVSALLNIKDLTIQSINLINKIVEELFQIDFSKNTLIIKKFKLILNNIFKTDIGLLNDEIALLYKTFLIIKDKVFLKINESISSLHVSKKKNIVINFIKNIIRENNDESLNILISKIQNSTKFIKYFFNLINHNFVDSDFIIKQMKKVLTLSQVRSSTLFPIVGSKRKFVNTIQSIYSEKFDKEMIDSVVIPFLASGQDFLNVAPLLKPDTKIILNSNNRVNSQLFIDLRDNKNELIKEVSKLESVSIYNNYDTTKIQYKNMLNEMKKELNVFEKKELFNTKTSALFLFLSNKSFGGNVKFQDGISKMHFSTTKDRVQSSVIEKIEHMSWWINRFDNVVIENEDYRTILEKYNNKTTLTIMDPLYVEENSESEELLSNSVQYGIDSFDHQECIDYTLMLDGQFIYHNYNNKKLVELMMERNDVSFVSIQKIKNNTTKQYRQDKVKELVFFTDKTKNLRVENNIVFERNNQDSNLDLAA